MSFNSWKRTGSKKNDYLYNGKEMQDELDLGWMDYGARMYDGAIGRWHVVDPLSEKYADVTPYSYVANMPTVAIDPNGKEIVIVGDAEYTAAVLRYIVNLAKSSEKGFDLLAQASASKRTLVIANTKDGKTEIDEGGDYDVLAFNVDDAENGYYDSANGRNGDKLKKTGETLLAHEFSHFLNEESGFLLEDNKYENYDIRQTELKAVEDENIVRKQMGLAERTHYGGKYVYGKQAVKSKYDRFYRTENKSNYGEYNGATSCDIKSLESVSEQRQTYYYNGKYLSGGLVQPLPTSQLRIRTKK